MYKKYKLTSESITYHDHRLYQIVAVRDFSDVRKGDLGGWVESERNLSQTGDCWIYDDGKCYGHGLVDDDSKICDEAEVYDEGLVCDSAVIKDKIKVCGTSTIESDAIITGVGKIEKMILSENMEKDPLTIWIPGPEFNKKSDEFKWDIERFLRSEDCPDDHITLKNVATKESQYPILIWCDKKTLYWYSEAEEVYLNEDSSEMFLFYYSLRDISGLKDIKMNKVKDISEMFYFCSLENLDALSDWDTKNIQKMKKTFSWCDNLNNIDGIRNWQLTSADDLSYFFERCESLVQINALKNWNTKSIKSIMGMFEHCINLENIDGLEKWDVSRIEDISNCFRSCKKIASLKALSCWRLSQCKYLWNTFEECDSLTSLDGLENLFRSTKKLPYLEIWNTFNNCANLTDASAIDFWKVYHWKISSARPKNALAWKIFSAQPQNGLACQDLNSFFYNCPKLKRYPIWSKWNIQNFPIFIKKIFSFLWTKETEYKKKCLKNIS